MGVSYNLDNPTEFNQALNAATGWKAEAKHYFESSRHVLMETTRLVNQIKAYAYDAERKEVCHA